VVKRYTHKLNKPENSPVPATSNSQTPAEMLLTTFSVATAHPLSYKAAVKTIKLWKCNKVGVRLIAYPLCCIHEIMIIISSENIVVE